MASNLRPETKSTNDPALFGGTAYFAILNAVKAQPGLIAGKLNGPCGEHCAIGSYFALKKHMALPMTLIDEVAAVNDSMPNVTPIARKRAVMRWLKWKLGTLGFPGFQNSLAK